MQSSVYLTAIRERGGLWQNLPGYVLNGSRLLWARYVAKRAQFQVKFGTHRVQLKYFPAKQGAGSQGVFFFREHYEPLLEFGHVLLKQGDVAFDIGSNQGVYACAFGRAVGAEGRVIAVEPIPRQVARITENLSLNGLRNVSIIDAAISDEVGQADLDLSAGDTSASIVSGFGDDRITVKTTTIDELLRDNGLDRVDFIKLDVEAAELMALTGADETLKAHRPIVCLEAADAELFGKIEAKLAGYGYAPWVFDKPGRLAPMAGFTKPEANVFFMSRDTEARLREERMLA